MAAGMLHARTLSIAALAVVALAAPGCGGDDSGAGGDDESQVRDTVTNYASAVADRDGDKACGYLTDAAREQVEKAAKALKADGCAGVMEKVTEGVSSGDRDKLGSLEVTSVKVDGDHATAQTKVEGEDTDPATLLKEGDEWHIDIDPAGSGAATAEAATVTSP